MLTEKQFQIIELLEESGALSSSEIASHSKVDFSLATTKREIRKLMELGYVLQTGRGKLVKYQLALSYKYLKAINLDKYFELELDERNIKTFFDFSFIENDLNSLEIFTRNEMSLLNNAQEKFLSKTKELNELEYDREMERLAIDLSWKSSQIEGNTYSLLETEMLLKDKKTASGKTKDEAVMLLNHKDAIDFILDDKQFLNEMNASKIEQIHSILVKELPIPKSIRQKRVGITGTNYKPLDNKFQIIEGLELCCKAINKRKNTFEKAFLALVLLSYLQAFDDGNKRTARIISNAILIGSSYCPISFRTVDSIEYKKAMLVFYELNNISPIKEIFIEQFDFAVETYF